MNAYVNNLVRRAKEASYKLINLDTLTKNKCLLSMAHYLLDNKEYIIAENKKDIAAAIKNKLQKSFIDRLSLNEKRLQEMAAGLREVANLPDPINVIISTRQRPNGLTIKKVRVPIGTILIIYEARPNVTSDCIGLLFKASDVAILRGGRDAHHSNLAIAAVLEKALKAYGIDFKPFFVVEKIDYSITDALLKAHEYIDLVIPRGGETLIRKVVEKSRIPVIKHYKGICHLYVDSAFDMDKALKVCVNAKVQRPSVCNAVEKILVHREAAAQFLPQLKKEFDAYNVEIRGDSQTQKILRGIKKATEKDWSSEYLDLIIAVKVVKNIDEAIAHINRYGSHHTDGIITSDKANAAKFTKEIDSACCFVNISTRFSDGYEFGLGAEIGISTDKLHARGPMGLEELTTYKWVAEGDGQIRE
ncbi:MAG: glutamate-5-semialdehyde dehydrogenase [Candidatus Omnitrophica bacterium]|nr:glutamate-5-semialdehyde dehydrogenase [Candidatus Omnitrophota bacterium]